MLNKSNYLDTLLEYKNTQQMVSSAYMALDTLLLKKLKYLNIDDYYYDSDLAVEELGLDLELVYQLIDDYVMQILRSKQIFLKHINKLKLDKMNNTELDYTELRDFTHKNLGVARNLRIGDAEKLLFRMMKDDDLNNILICLEALIASAIILRPECAYNTLVLMRVKDSF